MRKLGSAGIAAAALAWRAQAAAATPAALQVHYRTVKVGGLRIFYREAGRPDAPNLLLLHGFPTPSHTFRELMPLLADRYHLVAPNYPGFGYSATPSVSEFSYTFDHLADVVEQFTDALHLQRYALCMQDYGGPVGFRLATRRPERITALLIQNANAYDEGITPTVRRLVLRLWTDHSEEAVAALKPLFERPATEATLLEGAPDPTLVSPDSWEHAQWGMDRPGDKDIQFALQANYGSNPLLYDAWHAYFRRYRPPTLVAWARRTPSSPSRVRPPTDGICRTPRCTSSTPATSPWKRRPGRSRATSGRSWRGTLPPCSSLGRVTSCPLLRGLRARGEMG